MPEGAQLRGAQHRRHLSEPRRRVMAEQANDRLPAGLAAQAGHSLEERQVSLTRSVGLDASPLGDAQAIAAARFDQESLDEGRLTDPGLTGHENDLPGPGGCVLKVPAQLE